MEPKTQPFEEIPTALPGSEEDDAREKLLLDAPSPDSNFDSDEDDTLLDEESPEPKKRRWQILRTVAGFAVFALLLVFAVAWFFRIGWFADSKAQPVSRTGRNDAATAPVTEDEKLKMALSLVAVNAGKTNEPVVSRIDPKESPTPESASESVPVDSRAVNTGIKTSAIPQLDEPTTPSLAQTSATPAPIERPDYSKANKESVAALENDVSDTAVGRSLFFGLVRKPIGQAVTLSRSENSVALPSASVSARKEIAFGTLLPVRLIGAIYTLRNSGGLVRMELTRPVEGDGYSYPAGTTIVGNVRGGESNKAFVTVVGLIDPGSGELIKFGGELLGRDGSSGIEGKRRKLTSQWARFFNGLKETASAVAGSIGSVRSGGTVILSEPLRKGSESMSQGISGAFLGNGKDTDTFIEVSAGANGYVLVTDLPTTKSFGAMVSKEE